MTLDEAKKYWEWKYDRAKDYYDNHWEADERREFCEWIEELSCSELLTEKEGTQDA